MQESCSQYWPAAVGGTTEFGEYIIDLISEEVMAAFITRRLSVLNKRVRAFKAGTCVFNYSCAMQPADSESTPSDSVPGHLLDRRRAVL